MNNPEDVRRFPDQQHPWYPTVGDGDAEPTIFLERTGPSLTDLHSEERTSATLLDPAVWPSFADSQEMYAHLRSDKPRRRRGRRGSKVWSAVLLGLLLLAAFLAWRRSGPPLSVTGVSTRVSPGHVGCNETAVVVGTIRTNGSAGSVRYRWRRSDGVSQEPEELRISQDARSTEVVLRWTLRGHGRLDASAVLQVLFPTRSDATSRFTYTCR
jgi:hypothetical protein